MKDYLKYTSFGFEILAYIGVPTTIGYFLDKHFETAKPWFLLAFALLGCGIAIYKLISFTKNL